MAREPATSRPNTGSSTHSESARRDALLRYRWVDILLTYSVQLQNVHTIARKLNSSYDFGSIKSVNLSQCLGYHRGDLKFLLPCTYLFHCHTSIFVHALLSLSLSRWKQTTHFSASSTVLALKHCYFFIFYKKLCNIVIIKKLGNKILIRKHYQHCILYNAGMPLPYLLSNNSSYLLYLNKICIFCVS